MFFFQSSAPWTINPTDPVRVDVMKRAGPEPRDGPRTLYASMAVPSAFITRVRSTGFSQRATWLYRDGSAERS